MIRVRKRRTALICFGILLALPGFLFVRESKVNRHLRKLREAHLALDPARKPFDAFRFGQIKFTLGLKIPMDEFKKHQEALVTLGYFQNTNLAFATTNLLRDFVAEIKNLPITDTNWSYSIEGTNLLLTAAVSDIHLWTATASNLNAISAANHGNQ